MQIPIIRVAALLTPRRAPMIMLKLAKIRVALKIATKIKIKT